MQCRICDERNLEPVIDLGYQPWCNHFLKKEEIGKEPFYPLNVVYCHDCHTAQLDYTVKKEIMFGDHTYLSGITKSLSKHFEEVAYDVDNAFYKDIKNKSILDIGSNDGTQLKHFQSLGYDVLGVEASKATAKIANDHGVPTLNEFFNLDIMKKICRKFDIFNASGVFFHLEELHSVCEGIQYGLKEDGVFIVQFLYMKNIIQNGAFDQIYHEHLLYYTLETIETLLTKHGLSMFDASLSPIHGGSIIGYITHVNKRKKTDRLEKMLQEEKLSNCNSFHVYIDFQNKIKKMKEDNLIFLEKQKKNKKTIYGFGAPVKGNTLLNYFGIGTDYIDCLVEKNKLRKDLYSPGMHIPIVMEDEVKQNPSIYYVLAWNFKKEILSNNQNLINKGVDFFFPICAN